MRDGVITMLVHVPRSAEDEIVVIAKSDRVSTWREADTAPVDRPTDVSLDVVASSEFEARQLVRAALGRDLDLDAFLASTG